VVGDARLAALVVAGASAVRAFVSRAEVCFMTMVARTCKYMVPWRFCGLGWLRSV